MNKERKKYEIIFYGTPKFATESLKAIYEAGYTIKAVVTVADKPAGRGRKLSESPVKKYAKAKDLRILQPTNLKDPDFLHEITDIDPDLQVVVAFRMLPDSVISAAKDGTINLHASLLPRYRGAAPINHALIQGEKETGLTTFFIESTIDTGAIIDQLKVSIEQHDTAGSLHDKLMTEGAGLLVESIDKIRSGNAKAVPQIKLVNDRELKKAPKIFTENCFVDFTQKTEKVYNFIRGLSPYPAARIWLKNRITGDSYTALLLKVLPEKENLEHQASEIISDNKKYFKIATNDGCINVLEIKMQGKKAMDIKSFLNGFDINSYFLE